MGLALLLAPAVTSPAAARSVDVRLLPLELPAAPETDRRIGKLQLLGAFSLTSSDSDFGGLSALLVEGDRLIALSDRATLWRARMRLADDGTLLDLGEWRTQPAGDPQVDDTEALARLTNGALALANEIPFRLRALEGDLPDAAALLTGALAGLDSSRNQGVEALASLPQGGLLAIVEGSDDDGLHPLLTLRHGRLTRNGYAAADGYRPTGADRIGNDVFVIERRFSLLGGFQSRVVVLDVERIAAPGATLAGRELGRLGPASFSENFEGLAAAQSADGAVLLYLVSDDNFNPLQRTLLLQLRWRPEGR